MKLVRSLARRKHRDETGLFLAEGLDFAVRATEGGFRARYLVLAADHRRDDAALTLIEGARSGGAQVAAVPRALLSRMTGKDNPQDLLLVAEQRWAAALPSPIADGDVILVLDRIRDPRNLGAVFRTAAAAGARGVVLAGECCDPFSPEAVRASAGSLFAVPVM
ncbi:MAG: RNA methyltransferase, partial [Pseudomonadota bacterium]|nr:RNA methyltransferase [Pseudomonadota bacterium]